ncbi:SDR family NAD(P)-dependent oxidoreductase [Microbacterium sp. B19]|uniref:SDR family NAD(P)-dependent oxidoreductase n=1 Tax=Microbacterium sp. B19 TaxID=96765 RepID=UPI000345530B|nr:SDR family NAD(P)-dependent oxidoreductase [Microbacterium sp. B19]
MSFDGKVAIVTGGASGIGEATAKLLAAKGAHVLIADVTDAAGARVVGEIEAAGGSARFRHVDVSRPGDAHEMVADAVATWGGLHYAANVAGIGQVPSRLHDMEEGTWDLIMNIDLKGMWRCMVAEIEQFLTSGGGAIVNVASGAGMRATVGQPAYGIAKAGVIQMTRQGALEYAKDGIRVNSVAPGLIDTPAVKGLPDDLRAMYAAGQPGGRMGEPEEIAATIAWLLSDEASFVSGLNHLTDGGWFQMSPA